MTQFACAKAFALLSAFSWDGEVIFFFSFALVISGDFVLSIGANVLLLQSCRAAPGSNPFLTASLTASLTERMLTFVFKEKKNGARQFSLQRRKNLNAFFLGHTRV